MVGARAGGSSEVLAGAHLPGGPHVNLWDYPMWSPDSWRTKPALQQPEYTDCTELDRVLAELRVLPPLVTSWEILQLREQLAEAAEGRRFVLQGGDCAERFIDCT